jgi:hypothetical protein
MKFRAGFFLILLTSLLSSRAGSPHLGSLLPAGGQRGKEVDVVLQGERLQEAEEIIFYEAGIKASKFTLVTNKVVKAQFEISPACDPGEHHLRLRTRSGFSELITFSVGAFPVLAEREPNNEIGKAQSITLNSTIEGVITSEDVDMFSFDAKKGELISVDVEGMRLGRGALDARIALMSTNGSFLAEADDTALGVQDPFLSISAPSNGTYVISLREVTYAGSDKCRYRLHVGSFPRPTSIFPMGGPAGELLKISCFSEATGEFENEIKLPALFSEKFPFFAQMSGFSAPTPNWLRVTPFPNVLAEKGNQDREHATRTVKFPPLALNGILAQKMQEDWFCFPASNAVPLDVNVYARRLHSPVDSEIAVFDSAGKSLISNDDNAGPDSSLKFTPSATTNYFLRIRDTLKAGGRDFVYRLEITTQDPRVAVKIPEVARNDTQSRQYITVPRGNRFATLISVKRANFKGDLNFAVPGLPPGVKLLAEPLVSGQDSAPVVFEADTNSVVGGKLLNLVVTGTNENQMVTGNFSQEIDLVPGPNNSVYYSTHVDRLCVAVTKEAPFRLRIVEPKVPLVQGGAMRLEIVADRDVGFEEPIEIKMVWNPPGVTSQSEATILKGATNVFYSLNAGAGAELKSWKVVLLGRATVEGGDLFVSTQPVALEVAPPYVSGKIETTYLNPGSAGKLTVNLQQLKPFEGSASIRLEGLPEKVTATAKQIKKEDQEVVFDLIADPQCPVGSQKNLFCTLEVPLNGQLITHTLGAGGILRVTKPGKALTKVVSTPERKAL